MSSLGAGDNGPEPKSADKYYVSIAYGSIGDKDPPKAGIILFKTLVVMVPAVGLIVETKSPIVLWTNY